jgi:ferredoxin
MYKVKVDRDLCIGVSNCVAVAPTVFQLDNENKAIVLDPTSVDEEMLMTAASSCPEKAIILEDDKGNQVWP